MALNDKVAVVTGAAMGIGEAITDLFLKNGARVSFSRVFFPFTTHLLSSIDPGLFWLLINEVNEVITTIYCFTFLVNLFPTY